MEYKIRSKNIIITDAMHQHLVTTFNKLLKYQQVNENDLVHADIEFTKENNVVINISIDIRGKNNFLKAQVHNSDFYKAVDQALHKVEEQLQKIKGKREDRHSKNQPLGKVYATTMEVEEDHEEEFII
ncbi:ribosome hibernation-promoting factor, HPF/YfiA family [Spiroplasma endosymbiont of Stenodema calcarata]|uniref:ribosome hibernation-promoting factor, HPF/YfiA family n=1 Tax=Spiroplasma endosymbiont of Stenodema calcarata TaxID=3139328 RepID=UPI003CCAE2EC